MTKIKGGKSVNNVHIRLWRRIILIITLFSMMLLTTCQLIKVTYSAEAVTYTIPNGIYWIINAHSGKALTRYNSGSGAGTNIVQSVNTDSTSQRWQVSTQYNSSYSNDQCTMIFAVGTYGECLATASSTLSNGVNVQLSGTGNTQVAHWDIVQIGSNGNYKIVSKCNSSFAVTVHNASLDNNANVFAYTYNSGIPCNDEWIFVPVAGSALETVTIAVQKDSALQTEYLNNNGEIHAIFADAMKPFYNKFHIQLVPSFYTLSAMQADDCGRPYDVECKYPYCQPDLLCYDGDRWPNHHKNFNYNALNAWEAYGRDGNNLRIILSGFQMCNNVDGHSLGALGWWPSGRDGMVEINTYNRSYTQNVRVIQHELSHAFGCSHCDNRDCIMYNGDSNLNYDTEYNNSTIWCIECESAFDRFKY